MELGKVLIINLLLCVCICGLTYWSLRSDQKKIAVVDAVRLFNNFQMKSELEQIAKLRLQLLSKRMDSISNVLQLTRQLHNDRNEVMLLSSELDRLKNELDKSFLKSNEDINLSTWKRLNPMVEKYGKQKELRLIIGANGMGSVLYTDGYYDVTNDLIKYVNKSYAEGN